MENLPIILLCSAVGLILIWTAVKDRSPGWWILFLIGGWFIALPVCLLNGWNKAFVLLLTIPLGVSWSLAAVHGLMEPWKYCIPAEAAYIKSVYVGSSKRNHVRFYAMECKYRHGNRGYQEKSQDHYTSDKIEKLEKTAKETRLTIWVNKKNSREFKVKRYHGMAAYTLLLVVGIGFLWIAIQLIAGELTNYLNKSIIYLSNEVPITKQFEMDFVS